MNIDNDFSSCRPPEQVAKLFLPLVTTIEADHLRVFLAVCKEDGASLQKLARITDLGLSEVIRATSFLQDWQEADCEQIGLLSCSPPSEKGYRKQVFLTAQGHKLRNSLVALFNEQIYAETSLNFHQAFQQALSEAWLLELPNRHSYSNRL